MRQRVWALSVALLVGANPACAQSKSTWTQLSLSTCNVNAFLDGHPEHDGRGVVIAILDTGVDPSIPGLTRTPAGEVKVIDVQDFTGQGDVELRRVRLNEAGSAVARQEKDGAPVEYALPPLPGASGAEERRFWFGTLDEKRFVNSDMPDLNDNGKTDDAFAVLVTALAGDGDDQAVCYVDTNLDRSFADEKPLRSYRLDYDTFTLHRAKPEVQIEPVTFAINVFLRQSKVVVHYDDGAHGTHVAGIAAGYRINNQDGFHGVAPGAKLMSLKIGKNSIGGVSSTESMKQALEYAARYAREHGVPVVCNMSYGVDSVLEGQSDIDKLLDKVLTENPYLVFCTSAGNEGPGLSTVGTPAAATRVISVAALLAADSARDVQGFTLSGPVVTPFSSRGGELDKPDVAAPGWATSTVPRWTRGGGDYWAGTSMASPQVAGFCAVLISHVRAQHPNLPVRACDVRQALRLAGRPVEGANVLDFGWGVPDLPTAGRILAELVRAAADDPVIDYDIATTSPLGPGGKCQAAFWRSPYFPTTERQTFTVTPVFGPTADAAVRTTFARKYELRSTVPWCKLPQETTYLRGEQSTRIFVEYDAEQLQEPGLYTGTVEAVSDGRVAFRLLNTIIVPERFRAAEDFSRRWTGREAHGWTPDRYFVTVPPGASAMTVTLSAPEGAASKARVGGLFSPHGLECPFPGGRLDTDAGTRRVTTTLDEELTPGVWEVIIFADRPDRTWPYELQVRFLGLHADPVRITEDTSGSVTVTNLFEQPLYGAAEGTIEGFRLRKEDKFKGLKDELSYSVTLDERFQGLRVKLEMTPEAYATTTDIGVAVEDGSGKAVSSGGFSGRTFETTVAKPNPAATVTWTVKIRSGFAVADDQRETPITVLLDYLLAEEVPVEVTWDGEANVTFVPSVPVKLDFAVEGDLPAAPDGTGAVGFLRVRERSSKETALRVPIEVGD
ncbi:MAG TPA: S8 family serine peptidase [Phycisphaerae bacterium]|nr:S8 family serine peptidase [Phycisphaerae bacterium]HNU43854.1 S8 family serine peptidase [Phycisphaerae bacterium]